MEHENSRQQAYRLTTHRYNPDYAHMDDGEYLDWEWKEMNRMEDTSGDMYMDGSTDYYIQVRVYGAHSSEEFREVMRDEFRRGCSCERDCCGHLSGGVYGIYRNIRTPNTGNIIGEDHTAEYIVSVSYTPNY